MVRLLKELLIGKPEHLEEKSEKKYQIATCCLFIELANADGVFEDEELNYIVNVMKKMFSLSDEEVQEIIKLAKERINKSISIYEFTNLIDKEFTNEEKYEVVKNLWKLILSDEQIAPEEEYFVRKVTSTLNLSHKDFIAAKMEAKNGN